MGAPLFRDGWGLPAAAPYRGVTSSNGSGVGVAAAAATAGAAVRDDGIGRWFPAGVKGGERGGGVGVGGGGGGGGGG